MRCNVSLFLRRLFCFVLFRFISVSFLSNNSCSDRKQEVYRELKIWSQFSNMLYSRRSNFWEQWNAPSACRSNSIYLDIIPWNRVPMFVCPPLLFWYLRFFLSTETALQTAVVAAINRTQSGWVLAQLHWVQRYQHFSYFYKYTGSKRCQDILHQIKLIWIFIYENFWNISSSCQTRNVNMLPERRAKHAKIFLLSAVSSIRYCSIGTFKLNKCTLLNCLISYICFSLWNCLPTNNRSCRDAI